MKNIVSFETARRLKEAGFKQPEPEFGQVWLSSAKGYPNIIIGATKQQVNYAALDVYVVYNDLRRDFEMSFVFAPTATDILREIPGHNLAFSTENGWHCFFMDFNGIIYSDFQSDNPAEAAALAWLAINEKK